MASSKLSKQQRLDQIGAHLMGKFHLPEEQVEQMLPEFVQTLVTHMQNIQLALEECDPDQLGRTAHTMKGALLNLGLEDCVELAREIELQGKSLNRDYDYAQQVEKLRLQLGELIQ